jgi:hypothetical protein
MVDAEAHGAAADLLSPFIEQRQLAAGLLQAAGQPGDLHGMGVIVLHRYRQTTRHVSPSFANWFRQYKSFFKKPIVIR